MEALDDPAVTALALKTLAIFARVSLILFFLGGPVDGFDPRHPLRVSRRRTLNV